MYSKTLICLVLVCSLLAVACGGGKDDVLHFTGRDETAKNFQNRIRLTAQDNPIAMQSICKQLDGPSAKEAIAVVRRDDDAEGAQLPPGAWAKPGQKATQSDIDKSVKIIKSECKRSAHG